MMAGQKVVCIDDKFPLGIEAFYVALPKAGVTYVVRDVSLGVNFQGEEGEVAVTLIGLHNPKSTAPPFPERAFKAERFRPLEDDRLTEEALAERADTLVGTQKSSISVNSRKLIRFTSGHRKHPLQK